MGGFNPFKKPKLPPAPKPIAPPPPPPPPPTKVESAKDIGAAQEAEKQKRKTQKGRAATLLTSGQGVLGDDSAGGLATKKLLGG